MSSMARTAASRGKFLVTMFLPSLHSHFIHLALTESDLPGILTVTIHEYSHLLV